MIRSSYCTQTVPHPLHNTKYSCTRVLYTISSLCLWIEIVAKLSEEQQLNVQSTAAPFVHPPPVPTKVAKLSKKGNHFRRKEGNLKMVIRSYLIQSQWWSGHYSDRQDIYTVQGTSPTLSSWLSPKGVTIITCGVINTTWTKQGVFRILDLGKVIGAGYNDS